MQKAGDLISADSGKFGRKMDAIVMIFGPRGRSVTMLYMGWGFGFFFVANLLRVSLCNGFYGRIVYRLETLSH